MKILVIGDTHGYEGRPYLPVEESKSHIWRACKLAEENQIDTVVQVGDFGYWGESFIHHVQQCAEKQTLQFIG